MASPNPTSRRPRRNWFSFSLRSLLILTTLICLGIGLKQQYEWRRKRALIHEWIAPLVHQARAANGDVLRYQHPDAVRSRPVGLAPEDEIAVLMFGILESETSEERFASLQVLVESRREDAFAVLRDLLPRSQRHPELQAVLLHLLALARDPDDLAHIEPYLEGPLPEIRAAAAESIGFLRAPAYGGDDAYLWELEARMNTLPPVPLGPLYADDYSSQRTAINQAALRQTKDKWPLSVRERLEKMMLRGPTELERTAAARALVTWPPDYYTLRVAEWGVWIDNEGKLDLVESVLAENPPFVHGTANSVASLPRNRFDGPFANPMPMTVTKPIVHLTARYPLAVDLEVAIQGGRPWYTYPRPDAFTVHTRNGSPRRISADILQWPVPDRLRKPEAAGLSELDSLSEGYPWLHPEHRGDSASRASLLPDAPITGVGFRWQSLIVSPERTRWQVPPTVPLDPRYEWWESLRKVPSCWVTSRDETERFLYYDGPTSRSPAAVRWVPSESRLVVHVFLWNDPEDNGSPLFKVPNLISRDLLLIDATESPPRGCVLHPQTANGEKKSIPLENETWLTSDAIEGSFRDLLYGRGLTEDEAEGLLIAWRQRFFQNPGRRVLFVLSPEQYDRLCPLEIHPPATETVRVGIVLTEF